MARRAGVVGGKGGRGFPVRFANTAGGGGGGGSVTVTGISPSWGTTGDTVTITGTNFASGQAVLLDGTTFTSITYDSSTQITAVVPSGFVAGTTYGISVAGVTLANAFRWYSAAPLFQSAFSNSTGTGSAAIRDGTAWDADVYNPAGYLEVVTASGAGINDDWPSANALRVTRSTTKTARAWTSLNGAWSLPAVGETRYFRVYFRSENATDNGSDENSHHPIESAFVASGGSASGNTYTFKFAPQGSGKIAVSWGLSSATNPFPDYKFVLATAGGSRAQLNTGETYRLEWALTRLGTNSYTWNIRVYDAANALVGSDTNRAWRAVGSPYGLVESASRTIDDTAVVDFRIGTNGGAWANVGDEYHYFGGVMVRSDTWCGAY